MGAQVVLGDVVLRGGDLVLDLEKQRRFLRVEPRDLVVLAHLVGEVVEVEVGISARDILEEEPLACRGKARVEVLVSVESGGRRVSISRGEMADARAEEVVLDAPLQQRRLQARHRHLLINLDGLLVVRRGCREASHLEQALVGGRRRLLACVVVGGLLVSVHRILQIVLRLMQLGDLLLKFGCHREPAHVLLKPDPLLVEQDRTLCVGFLVAVSCVLVSRCGLVCRVALEVAACRLLEGRAGLVPVLRHLETVGRLCEHLCRFLIL
mmetsp:Transcript_2707/g.5637  ORF Transcript_2707/g.5637 Transcript_2707/m.5637 type:complete len:267 (-) Transcript_2707:209-1009(-)